MASIAIVSPKSLTPIASNPTVNVMSAMCRNKKRATNLVKNPKTRAVPNAISKAPFKIMIILGVIGDMDNNQSGRKPIYDDVFMIWSYPNHKKTSAIPIRSMVGENVFNLFIVILYTRFNL